ncbi:MAG TPA: chorismate lyase [Burkholderiaceae bacterium]|nr:chorismate lyase [Burkholderiaceae bacterium]
MRTAPLDRALRGWLQSDGSLSRRLARVFGRFEVQVLSQGAGPAQADELCVLRRSGGVALSAARCHVREVMLWGNGQPLVYARSVLPAVQSRLAWRALRGLGSRPLADLLFGLRAASCARLGSSRMVPLRARRLGARLGWAREPLWCRRSVFMRRGMPLLVTEWFAPSVCQCTPGAPTGRGTFRGFRGEPMSRSLR